MTRDFKIFIVFFILGVPFWLAVNFLEAGLDDFFYGLALEKHPVQFLIADIEQKRLSAPEFLDIKAESAFSVSQNEKNEQKIIYRQNEKKVLAIASLTKLMTGIIVDEFYQPGLKIKISQNAVSQFEDAGDLTLGEVLTVKDLLYIMLIESSNDAAAALTEIIGSERFVDLMNLKARELGMFKTIFYSANGLDPEENGGEASNFSTVEDLVKLGAYAMEKPIIWDAISQKYFPLFLENGRLHHVLKNTNELLWEFSRPTGGKTGYTGAAGGCLIFLFKCASGEKIANVILNSPDRFGDMRKLANYALAKRQCH